MFKGVLIIKIITVFTPTYNRKEVLKKLYVSLINQTNLNFVWLIIDDGSTDNTQEAVNSWIKDEKIEINYYKQENQGKSMAHNKGVELTKTELFTCVDSDDYLDNNAIEIIIKNWERNSSTDIVGILAYKGWSSGKPLTMMKDNSVEITTLKDAYSIHGLKGDTLLVYRTSLISKYEFPNFKGEYFVPEAYLYDLLDKDGNLLIVRQILFYGEYLEDGYTNNMAKLISKNPQGYLVYIKQRLTIDKSLKEKLLDTIRYIAVYLTYSKVGIIKNSVYPMLTVLMYPFGYLFYIKRYKIV